MYQPMPHGFEKPYAAFLFDMDGTILNSILAAERVWSDWARRHGLDVAAFLPKMHGSRGIDTITRLNLPGVDPEYEARLVTEAEIADVGDVVAISGAAAFLASLPPDRWAIVTSSPLRLARRRLEAAGLPLPKFMVTAEDVTVGKPDPQCYILGAERLGVSTRDCLVFEDVAAGIKAGEAAGADVMVVTATHHQKMETPHPTISSYDEIAVNISADHKMLIVPSAA
ncbi:HAD family hydrolase [Rhizobium lentis]|uniref:HAD family hydrolase n=1 Tax=Rhizobium lentis TaxID=1138194 RepID=UPI001C829349|nr:HAD family hydrolase [Rhizobium lentis]MBX5132615.1 HAD family hydrolase [Rhizobium lentis]